ncbi:MAG: hypothetical protein K1X88_31300 [Nannocystaceae bacterium]|nr:hypothetical protein [Nannocystaceae bacterium]
MSTVREIPPFERLLERFVPSDVATIGAETNVRLCVGGREMPVVIRGVGQDVLQIGHDLASKLELDRHSMAVLRVLLGDGHTRIDLPVEVLEAGRASTVVRVHPSPLVLRRRVVRDHALAEAVGAPPATGPAAALVA